MTRILRILLASIGVLFCTFVLTAMAINVPVLFFIFSPLFFCIIVGLIFYATGTASRRRGIVVLSYLEQAVRLNLPLPAMLTAAAASEPPGTARLLRHLRNDLESGTSMANALRQTAPVVGRRITGLIESAERLGQLPADIAANYPGSPPAPAERSDRQIVSDYLSACPGGPSFSALPACSWFSSCPSTNRSSMIFTPTCPASRNCCCSSATGSPSNTAG